VQSSSSVRCRWPSAGPSGERDNFFVGIFQPNANLQVVWEDARSAGVQSRQGPGWAMAGATSPLHSGGIGLVHAARDNSSAVAFRGYVLPRLHSYSPDEEILRYWASSLRAEHNGVFSAAIIDGGGAACTLIVDVFGMSPLYYRDLGRATIFSTNPRYLVTDSEQPDFLAWRSLIQTSWVIGNRSLSRDIHRVPAGHALHITPEGRQLVAWFPPSRLPDGTRRVGPGAIAEVEDTFQQSVDRCLKVTSDSVTLPLSSGFDSRRILAALLHRQVPFEAITYRALQKEHRDLDARYAAAMARDLHFPHRVVEAESLEQFVNDDLARRILVDAQTGEHTWAMRVMATLPARPLLLFDGIGGDILGDPVGWRVHAGLAVDSRPGADDLEVIASHAITDVVDHVLNPRRWPEAAELRADLTSYLRPLLPRENLAEVSFLLLRQRRAIASWSQQLTPPGHVVVCPYLDLDYLRLLLSFKSSDKHETSFQRSCLREFWPEFYKYPGNRDIPSDLQPGSPAESRARIAACQRAMRKEITTHGAMPYLRDLLSRRKRPLVALSRYSAAFAEQCSWYLTPLMELVSREVRSRSCWTVSEGHLA
jgi:hypothetical protein